MPLKSIRSQLVAIAASSLVIFPGEIDAHALNAAPVTCPTEQQTSKSLPGFPGIELTTEQTNQIKAIEEQIRSQILALLTPAQLGNLIKTLEQDQVKNEDVFASLSLSGEQRKKLEEIFNSSRQQIMQTLTESQLEQLQQQSSPFTPVNLEQMHRTVSPFGY
ncbi:hypothetical protein K9N68_16610 [Kovacikia minuta CCNUW1]|uniref:hypothetical protein n=1 Tax=Kovacikia minuta TaxID=2931930 RepID=UPI001CCBF880|nr:hypothetical protein [Kovacikia minuta]UBF29307.1 hypothetical protein K9N68_16610 [Kovacikia minuta CCNUW1]